MCIISILPLFPKIYKTERFPDRSLLEGFSVFIANTILQELALQPNQILLDHYGPHSVVDSNITKNELKTLNSVAAASSNLKRVKIRDLMSHVVKTLEYNTIFPNLVKLATIQLLLRTCINCGLGTRIFDSFKN